MQKIYASRYFATRSIELCYWFVLSALWFNDLSLVSKWTARPNCNYCEFFGNILIIKDFGSEVEAYGHFRDSINFFIGGFFYRSLRKFGLRLERSGIFCGNMTRLL